LENLNIFKLFNITTDSDDSEIEKSYLSLKKKLSTREEQSELLENYSKISTKEKRYLYSLTSIRSFTNISELDKEIISRPNYVGPRQWLDLL